VATAAAAAAMLLMPVVARCTMPAGALSLRAVEIQVFQVISGTRSHTTALATRAAARGPMALALRPFTISIIIQVLSSSSFVLRELCVLGACPLLAPTGLSVASSCLVAGCM
jgi:hypothetical protein